MIKPIKLDGINLADVQFLNLLLHKEMLSENKVKNNYKSDMVSKALFI